MPFTYALPLFISLCLLLISSQAFSKSTLEDRFQVSVGLEETENIVPNQQLVLNVDLLSEGAFNGSVKLEYLDIENAIVIQPDGQTEIKTKEINGKQWFIQREKITVYPRKAGNFTVPEITLNVTVNDNEKGNITDKIKSKPYQFEVSSPAGLKVLKDVIASPKVDFTLTPKGQDKATDDESYQVGDAITYVYETKAQKQHVLLLSEIKIEDIDGVQAYRKPAVEKDEFDRFEKFNTASIRQEITFIFEKEGTFALPEQRLTWWNSDKGELQETVIKAQTIVVGEGGSFLKNFNPFNKFKITSTSLLSWVYIVGLVLLMLLVIWQLYRHKEKLISTFNRLNKTQQKQLTRKYFENIKSNNHKQAIASLYEMIQLTSGSISVLSDSLNETNKRSLNTLQQLAFSGQSKTIDHFDKQDAQCLLDAILKPSKQHPAKTKSFKFSTELNINK